MKLQYVLQQFYAVETDDDFTGKFEEPFTMDINDVELVRHVEERTQRLKRMFLAIKGNTQAWQELLIWKTLLGMVDMDDGIRLVEWYEDQEHNPIQQAEECQLCNEREYHFLLNYANLFTAEDRAWLEEMHPRAYKGEEFPGCIELFLQIEPIFNAVHVSPDGFSVFEVKQG